MSDPILAWHFTGTTLLSGAPIPNIGVRLTHDGALVMCNSGLHASVRAIDALQYTHGHFVHRVRCEGEIIHGDDKLVCRERTIMWSADAESTLRAFARACALDVAHLWEMPPIVREFLKTGDESKRVAARDAAGAAAWDAARAAAGAAAGDAARAAAGAAAREHFNQLVYECFSDFL